MQRVAGAQAKIVLVGKPRRGPEMAGDDGERDEALKAKPIEFHQCLSPMMLIELPSAKLDRKSGRNLGPHPFADREIIGAVLVEPSADDRRQRLVGNGRDHERRIEIEAQ